MFPGREMVHLHCRRKQGAGLRALPYSARGQAPSHCGLPHTGERCATGSGQAATIKCWMTECTLIFDIVLRS